MVKTTPTPIGIVEMTYRYFKRKLYHICWCSDLVTTRLSLSIASIVSGLFLLLPANHLDPTRTATYYVGQAFDWWVLALLFLVNGIATFYQLLKEPENHYWLTANSVLGCSIWTFITLGYFVAKYTGFDTFRPSIVSGATIAIWFASWWLLARFTLEKHCHAR